MMLFGLLASGHPHDGCDVVPIFAAGFIRTVQLNHAILHPDCWIDPLVRTYVGFAECPDVPSRRVTSEESQDPSQNAGPPKVGSQHCAGAVICGAPYTWYPVRWMAPSISLTGDAIQPLTLGSR